MKLLQITDNVNASLNFAFSGIFFSFAVFVCLLLETKQIILMSHDSHYEDSFIVIEMKRNYSTFYTFKYIHYFATLMEYLLIKTN